MVIKSILFAAQTLLFLVVFALGSVFLPFLPFLPVWQTQTGPGRAFVFDGVVFAVALCLVLLLIEAGRKRLRAAGPYTGAALLLAMVLGLLLRFGSKSL